MHILTLENLKLTTFSSGSQRAYCTAISSPSNLPKLYADSGRRSFSSVIGTFSGGCGCNGMPISVSDDARTTFFIPCFRLASRTLYVLLSMSDTPYDQAIIRTSSRWCGTVCCWVPAQGSAKLPDEQQHQLLCIATAHVSLSVSSQGHTHHIYLLHRFHNLAHISQLDLQLEKCPRFLVGGKDAIEVDHVPPMRCKLQVNIDYRALSQSTIARTLTSLTTDRPSFPLPPVTMTLGFLALTCCPGRGGASPSARLVVNEGFLSDMVKVLVTKSSLVATSSLYVCVIYASAESIIPGVPSPY